jgi:putative transposase
VDQELLLRNESLATEDRILRNQILGHLQLNDSDRIALAEIGKQLGRANVLERHALLPSPERARKTSWREFI